MLKVFDVIPGCGCWQRFWYAPICSCNTRAPFVCSFKSRMGHLYSVSVSLNVLNSLKMIWIKRDDLDRDYHMTTNKAHAAAAEVLPSLGVSFCHMTPRRYCPAVFLVGGLLFGLFFPPFFFFNSRL